MAPELFDSSSFPRLSKSHDVFLKQENVLAESRMMIPDCRKRLEVSLADLKAALVSINRFNALLTFSIFPLIDYLFVPITERVNSWRQDKASLKYLTSSENIFFHGGVIPRSSKLDKDACICSGGGGKVF
ncbi:Tubulin-specific chaperone A [Platanthera guangdongensis]|uniref:Tubulin-specific chaperone A n=1 Tax=Platanthera guangdongensis TaxID=2320717 RepID=A0ABR2MHF7_9ASPA